MWRETPFKICLILSTFIHIAILYPWSFLQFTPRPEITFQRLELTYFKVGEIEEVLIKEMKPITSIKRKSEKKSIKGVVPKKIEIDLKKSEEFPPETGPSSAEKIEQKKETAKDTEFEISKKTDVAEGVDKDRAMRDDYCLKVREKIKSMLEKYGGRFIQEGDVYVRFVIKRDGTLKDLVLYKKPGRYMRALEEISIKSIKEASPFPPFDELMKEMELPFDLPIRFSLRR